MFGPFKRKPPLVERNSAEASDAPPGVALRQRFLTGSAGDLGITNPGTVWGVAMDMSMSPEVATVTALADGNASLYTTGTFGIIGGFAHDRVREAAMQLCRSAEAQLSLTTATTDFSYPEENQIRFYLLTNKGARSVDADEETLGSGTHPLSELFFAAHNVISELRVIVQHADES